MNAVDTNVYVYALDADEPAKQAKALELFDRLMLQPSETVLLWQVASQLLSQLRKLESKGQLTSTTAESAFARFRAMFALRMPSESIFEISFDVCSRFSLSHWDGMLLAARKASSVSMLYSEDMAAGMEYDGVTIVNPFA
jgi:predicted nucleic acid-binding protein